MFDARQAKALPPGAHITVSGAPGLRLVATATTRRWVYRFKSPLDGRMRQTKLGEWPAMGLPAALAAWERVRRERAAGADPVVQRKADRALAARASLRAGYSVRVLCDEYLAAYAGTVVAKTLAEITRLFDRELSAIENTPAAEVTRAQAFDLLHRMRDRPVVARRLRQGLGAAWDRALDAGALPPETPNWWRLVLRGRLPSLGKIVAGQPVGPGKRVLDAAEVGDLLRWLPNFSRDVEDVLTLYLWTLCRGAEIVAMRRDEITREADGVWWTIPRARLKSRRNPMTIDLRVPLVGRALAVVERRLTASDAARLFPSPGRRGDGHIMQKAAGVAVYWHMPYCQTRPESARPRLPVSQWAPHDLRRTGRTMLSALGCPQEIGEALLGHLLPGVAKVYDRWGHDPERRRWLSLLSARLESLCAGPR